MSPHVFISDIPGDEVVFWVMIGLPLHSSFCMELLDHFQEKSQALALQSSLIHYTKVAREEQSWEQN